MAKKQASEGKWVETYWEIGPWNKKIVAKMKKLEKKRNQLKSTLSNVCDCPVCVEGIDKERKSPAKTRAKNFWWPPRCPLCRGVGSTANSCPGLVRKRWEYMRCHK